MLQQRDRPRIEFLCRFYRAYTKSADQQEALKRLVSALIGKNWMRVLTCATQRLFIYFSFSSSTTITSIG